ncbi:LOW QUALITY PROTEIN: hypothetical protein CVT25_004513 [Psilocybe cyanescens]|uniref:Fungal-type protein kinase domain-containing protein n=1 Tax=Psilocybe cyanescens TaxID=93625 RepID=A0A409XRW8_PSICY|nr:LOW QUALITY PROTEIN: hypothetical protein CVT25_004513 [Psilocybe cyanescens]
MTIESDMVTLWYHSRSHSAASKQFSFLKNPKLLTQIFMCFLFATKAELGYDTNIMRAPDGHYIYKIPQKDKKTCRFYRTVRPISQCRSNNITGRMARIFVVQEVDSTSSTQYILKDVWLDDEVQTEREIQDGIFSDIENFESTDPMLEKVKSLLSGILSSKAYKKHFLEIIDDFVGEKLKRVAPNSARTPGLLKMPGLTATLQSFSKALSKASAPISTTGLDRSSIGTTFSADLNANAVESIPHHSFLPKKRYRVVFKEVCTTVGDLGTLGEVVDVLNQVLTPLQLLFCAGWVRRDISSGNVMAHRVDNKWNVKLADLEYAKKYPPSPGYEPSDDPKTGTPFFMAHEILDLHQLHSNATKVAPPFDPDDIFAFPVEVNRPVPIHNFQHDLESVWWILLYTITLRVENSPSKALGYARTVFQNSNGLSKARRDCFVDSIRAKLNKVLLEDVRAFGIPMEWMRSRLHKGSVDREKDGLLREIGSYIEIHSQFANFLGRPHGLLIIASESSTSQSASSINPGDIPARVNKRPLPDQDEDDDSKDHKGSANKNGLAARMRPASKRSKRDDGNN